MDAEEFLQLPAVFRFPQPGLASDTLNGHGAEYLETVLSVLILIRRRDLNLAEFQGRFQDGAVHTFGETEDLRSHSSAALSLEVSDPPLNFLPVQAMCLIHIHRIIDPGVGVLKAVGVVGLGPVENLEKQGSCRSLASEIEPFLAFRIQLVRNAGSG